MINKNVLVTGANGMIGRQLVKLLKEKNYNVTETDLPDDLRNRDVCREVCTGQDIVFHLAGIKGSPIRCMESPASFSVPMIQFNANMIEASHNANVEWFLYTSSVGVYSPSEVFYEDDVWKTFPSKNDWYPGWAKRIGELNVQSYMGETGNKNCSIVRPANVYGPYDNFGEYSMVIPSLIKKGIESTDGKLHVWGDGIPIRDFIYSKDVACGMLHMVENKVTDPVNLASGTGITIGQIAEIISNYFNLTVEYDITKPNGDLRRQLSTDRAESYGFSPMMDLENGIKKTIDWYLNDR
ncbi:MAG: NAD-dependent epimerase/dehydratase family protein [Pelagibacteraceae bacterium]|nr:NAD-dependent epimerase/dehydratase family protein [Pelagibacteraceae bacterium]